MITLTGCVAVGLWTQYRYVTSSIYHEMEKTSCTAMEASVKPLLDELGPLPSPTSASGAQTFERARSLFKAKFPEDGDILIVDQNWRIVGQYDDHNQNRTAKQVPESQVSFTASAKVSPQWSKLIFGKLNMPDTTYLGLACPLDNNHGHAIFRIPIASIKASPKTLIESLPLISIVTLIWICVLAGIIIYMISARFYERTDHERTESASDVFRQAQDLVRTRDAIIFGLAKLAESRDPDTGEHLERISAYSTTLATALYRHPKFRNHITQSFVKLIGISSALHDIGKVGIEDRILCKPGKLTDEERTQMQEHPTIGGKCLAEIERRLGKSNFLHMAREIALAHHERWDGNGYPNRLAGRDIPLSARIVAIADVYDAITSKRVYKDAMSHEDCVDIILREAGKHFDPDIVEVWVGIEYKFYDIAQKYKDYEMDDSEGEKQEAQIIKDTQTAQEKEQQLPELVSAETLYNRAWDAIINKETINDDSTDQRKTHS
jgi:HD-GYP domain-containing protein (c-di-GMP phosphodiesterase class II)